MRWCVPFRSKATVGRLLPGLSCSLWEEEMVSPEDLLGSPTLRGPTGSVLPAPAQAFPLLQMMPSGALARRLQEWRRVRPQPPVICEALRPAGSNRASAQSVSPGRLLDLRGPSRFWMPALRWVSGSGPRLPLEGMGGTEEELAEP